MNDRARVAYQFFVSRGYTPAQAAGIVGGIAAESNFNPGAVGDRNLGRGQEAFGIGQWRLDRQQSLRQMAAQRGVAPTDFNTQLEFFDSELRGRERRAYQALRSAQDPSTAAVAMQHFFRPAGYTPNNPAGGHNTAGRQRFASQYGQQFAGLPAANLSMSGQMSAPQAPGTPPIGVPGAPPATTTVEYAGPVIPSPVQVAQQRAQQRRREEEERQRQLLSTMFT